MAGHGTLNMTEPTKEFKKLYVEWLILGISNRDTAWYWYEKGMEEVWHPPGYHVGFQAAREQRARHDRGQSKP